MAPRFSVTRIFQLLLNIFIDIFCDVRTNLLDFSSFVSSISSDLLPVAAIISIQLIRLVARDAEIMADLLTVGCTTRRMMEPYASHSDTVLYTVHVMAAYILFRYFSPSLSFLTLSPFFYVHAIRQAAHQGSLHEPGNCNAFHQDVQSHRQ